MKKTILLFIGFAFLTFKNQAQTVTDYDGNIYNTITIGTQTWKQGNLKVTHYCNGDPIPNVTDNTAWTNLTTGAYCNYNNTTNIDTINTYGRLYNWYTVVDLRNVCLTGWHVPSDGEWNIMEKYLDNTVDTTATGCVGTDIGGKLKEIGTIHWNSPNTGASNTSGFGALPGGYRDDYYGAYYNIGNGGNWRTTTAFGSAGVWGRILLFNNSQIMRIGNVKVPGFSIRCVRDSLASQINDNSINKNIQIFPNPATDREFINISKRQDLKMQIYNVVGECVMKRELISGKNEIDVSPLSKGIYVIKITGADLTVQRKLTKE